MSLTSEFPLNKMLLLFTSDLLEQRSELMRALHRTYKEIRALAESGPGDVIDDSSGNSSKEAMFTTYSQSRTQLRKIEAALKRIATGEFGICGICGGAIGLKRLRALPWANNCIECQERSEQGRPEPDAGSSSVGMIFFSGSRHQSETVAAATRAGTGTAAASRRKANALGTLKSID